MVFGLFENLTNLVLGPLCHLQYKPIGRSAGLADLDYVQPKMTKAHSALVTVAPLIDPVLVESDKDNDTEIPLYASHYQKKPSSPPTLSYDLTHHPPLAYSVSLKDLDRDKLIHWLYSLEHPLPAGKDKLAPTPLSCMMQDDIIQHLHHSGTTLPQVRPCDPSNELDTKLHWTAEELHHVMGCH
jgi:hypothetical protein